MQTTIWPYTDSSAPEISFVIFHALLISQPNYFTTVFINNKFIYTCIVD